MKKFFQNKINFSAVALAATSTLETNAPYVPKYLEGFGSGNPAEFISTVYQYALALVGIVALGAMIFGAIRWMTSAGNPGAVSEAKGWIAGALGGLALLLGAYLILQTINPQLVDIGGTEELIGSSFIKPEQASTSTFSFLMSGSSLFSLGMNNPTIGSRKGVILSNLRYQGLDDLDIVDVTDEGDGKQTFRVIPDYNSSVLSNTASSSVAVGLLQKIVDGYNAVGDFSGLVCPIVCSEDTNKLSSLTENCFSAKCQKGSSVVACSSISNPFSDVRINVAFKQLTLKCN